jgi:hypothetical protein
MLPKRGELSKTVVGLAHMGQCFVESIGLIDLKMAEYLALDVAERK